jgi:phosphoserine phosphatase
LLKGLDEAVIERCHAERVRITPGAEALVKTMRREGAKCLLVSGGFSRFAVRVAEAIGFSRAVSNELGLAEGKLSGEVVGPIVDGETKKRELLNSAAAAGIDLADTLAVGDGANDIPMLQAAGLGVAYHAKPKTAAAASARIEHCELTALLYGLRPQRLGGALSGGFAHVGGDCRECEGHGMFAAIEADPDPVARERLNDAADRSGFGVMQLNIRSDRGAGIGFQKGACGGDFAERRRRREVADQHAHAPPPPARGHGRWTDMSSSCAHLRPHQFWRGSLSPGVAKKALSRDRQGATGKQGCPAALEAAQSRSAPARVGSGPTRRRVRLPAFS